MNRALALCAAAALAAVLVPPRRGPIETARRRTRRDDRGVREVPRGARGRQPRRAVRSQGRGAVENAARAEERVAGGLRPRARPGGGQGRLRPAAALLRRRRQGDGRRAADRPLHGDAAGIRRRGARQAAVQLRNADARSGRDHHLRRRPVARHEDRAAADASAGARRPTRSGARSSSTAPAATTSRARRATARTASGSAPSSCRTSPAPTRRSAATRAGRATA